MYSVQDTLAGGFPHSEIHGSKLVRSSPWLIAAYHVLHRLLAPRHPPNALKTLDHSHYRCPLRLGATTSIRKTSFLREFVRSWAVKTMNCATCRLTPTFGQTFSSRCLGEQTTLAHESRKLFQFADCLNAVLAPSAWWSQTGSNRRPPACKAGALPTELWPRQSKTARANGGPGKT